MTTIYFATKEDSLNDQNKTAFNLNHNTAYNFTINADYGSLFNVLVDSNSKGIYFLCKADLDKVQTAKAVACSVFGGKNDLVVSIIETIKVEIK